MEGDGRVEGTGEGCLRLGGGDRHIHTHTAAWR